MNKILIPQDGGEPEMTDEEAELHIPRYFIHESYGTPKFEVDSPYEAKDMIKELNWDRTHRSWNDATNRWAIDFERLNFVIDHFHENGYDVTIDLDVARSFEDEMDMVFRPDHR